ncbi:MAG: pilus assembly protein N-terminal domain-containing protein, partial [bacterium]|nr:pilus assembly protein N-terminal domain-containing protein [bacterium]
MLNPAKYELTAIRLAIIGASVVFAMVNNSFAQNTGELIGPKQLEELETPPDAVRQKEIDLIDSVVSPELVFRIDPLHSKIMKTKLPITRISITDPATLEVNEFSPTEIELIGLKAGTTTLTMWFAKPNGDETILRYLVKVESNEGDQRRAETEFARLQARINELFPQSQIQLIPVADKLIVRGQARDSKEASEILALLGGQSAQAGGNSGGGLTGIGTVANLPGAEDLRIQSIVNLLNVPGEQQVMLKVRIAEISRSAARNIGVDMQIVKGAFQFQNLLAGGAGNITAILDGGDVRLFLNAFTSNGVGKLLAEPTLVTISGQPATFISGGEFAVPTTVGVGGVGAIATTFRGFGTQLTFTPTVIDKDKIRLRVAPSVSSINNANAVNGIPGLNTRGATTTVDLREGQWLAVAGLIQDEHTGNHTRVPF